MSHIIAFVSGLLVGCVAGLLIYRKHAASLKAKETELKAKGKAIERVVKG